MSKLYGVLLGGRADRCNTELHDTVFAVGDSLESCHPQLISKWFGNQHRLHIDSSVELNQVDGYDIVLKKQKPGAAEMHLFFVNFGAYRKGVFGEVHQIQFYVAKTKTQALLRAREELCLELSEQHCDDNLPVDDILSVDQVDDWYIHLLPATEVKPLCIQSYYRKLNVEATLIPDVHLV